MKLEVSPKSKIIKTLLENNGIGCTTESIKLSNFLKLIADAQGFQTRGLVQLEIRHRFVGLRDLATNGTAAPSYRDNDEAPATPSAAVTELPDNKATQVTKIPQPDRAPKRKTPQKGRPTTYEVTGCPPVPGYNTLLHKQTLNKPPSGGEKDVHMSTVWPAQQIHASKSGTHSNMYIKRTPAGHHASDRQRPSPNGPRPPRLPPELHDDNHMSRGACNQPVLGGARR